MLTNIFCFPVFLVLGLRGRWVDQLIDLENKNNKHEYQGHEERDFRTFLVGVILICIVNYLVLKC